MRRVPQASRLEQAVGDPQVAVAGGVRILHAPAAILAPISDSGKLVGLKAPYASLLAKQEEQLTQAAAQ